MGELISRGVQAVQRRKQPTVQEVIRGNGGAPEYTAAQRAGDDIAIRLAARKAAELDAFEARKAAAADAQRKADDRLLAEVQSR